MATLTDELKTLVVQELAMYRTPSEVADLVKEEHGVVVDRRQVQMYDPERSGKKPAKKWCDLFAATRKAFLDKKASLAITHRSWRQRELQDMVRRAKKSKNYKLAGELLEQAAKEEGDFYVNARANAPVQETDEQRVQRMRAGLLAMDEATLGPPSPSTPTLVVSAA